MSEVDCNWFSRIKIYSETLPLSLYLCTRCLLKADFFALKNFFLGFKRPYFNHHRPYHSNKSISFGYRLFWLISLFSVSGKVHKLRAHAWKNKQTKATQKNMLCPPCRYARTPQSMSVAASSAVHWSRHIGKGVDKLAPPTSSRLPRQTHSSFPPESRWNCWRAGSCSYLAIGQSRSGPFLSPPSGRGNGFIIEEAPAPRRSSVASLSSWQGMVKGTYLPN